MGSAGNNRLLVPRAGGASGGQARRWRPLTCVLRAVQAHRSAAPTRASALGPGPRNRARGFGGPLCCLLPLWHRHQRGRWSGRPRKETPAALAASLALHTLMSEEQLGGGFLHRGASELHFRATWAADTCTTPSTHLPHPGRSF